MRVNEVVFANFTLRFGNDIKDRVFLDLATEIVFPAFKDNELVRSYGSKTSYFFHKVSLSQLNPIDDDSWVLYGQFIKNTTISRDQIFKNGEGIVRNRAELATAPSAFFVLILSNHRLIYSAETRDAPDLNAFKATAKQFIDKKYNEFIDEKHKKTTVSKAAIRRTYKPPTLEIVPLTGKESISQFIDRYRILRRIEFNIIIPNDEIDAMKMFDAIRDLSRDVDATKTQLVTQNTHGLDKEKAKNEIESATKKGNQTVRVSGIDYQDQTLVGNNDEFKVSARLDSPEPTKIGKARQLWHIFEDYVQSNLIQFGHKNTGKVLNISEIRNKNE